MEAVINERKTHQEAWGPAALEQRRERVPATWRRSLRVAIAGSSATGIITNCWAFSFGFWLSHKRTCYQLVAEPAFIWLRLHQKKGKAQTFAPRSWTSRDSEILLANSQSRSRIKRNFGKPSSRARIHISCLTTSGTRWMCSRRCVISDRFACGTRACEDNCRVPTPLDLCNPGRVHRKSRPVANNSEHIGSSSHADLKTAWCCCPRPLFAAANSGARDFHTGDGQTHR